MPVHPGARFALLATTLALGTCQQVQNHTGAGTGAGRGTGTAGPSAGASATAQRTDADTAQVIDALAAPGAKPVETLSLSVVQVRSQPTPADAVRRVLQERGQFTAPRPVPRMHDISVPPPAGPIPARV